MAKNLSWILDNDITDLEMNFTYDYKFFSEMKSIELKPDGKNIIVKEENKKEYVKLVA